MHRPAAGVAGGLAAEDSVSGGRVDLVLLHPVPERLLRDAEQLRRAAALSLRGAQGREDQAALHRLELNSARCKIDVHPIGADLDWSRRGARDKPRWSAVIVGPS